LCRFIADDIRSDARDFAAASRGRRAPAARGTGRQSRPCQLIVGFSAAWRGAEASSATGSRARRFASGRAQVPRGEEGQPMRRLAAARLCRPPGGPRDARDRRACCAARSQRRPERAPRGQGGRPRRTSMDDPGAGPSRRWRIVGRAGSRDERVGSWSSTQPTALCARASTSRESTASRTSEELWDGDAVAETEMGLRSVAEYGQCDRVGGRALREKAKGPFPRRMTGPSWSRRIPPFD
jgi:hypothetical protein